AGIYGYSNTYSLYSNGAGSFKLNVYTNEIYYGSTFITDVDHPQVYTEKPFKGFTTGEVYVQYSFENSWTSSAMELYIQSILGLSGEELQKVAVSDVKMPEVEIDVQYTDEAEKSINVTYNKEFTLPTANVYDVNGENEYKLAVYYDYYTDNPKTVYLKNGKFTPDKLGVIYTAVYLAQDRFGNSNINSNGKCIDVINMIPTKGNALIYNEEKIDELNSCTINYLPKIDVISVNKEPKISVFVVSPSGERKDITDTFDGENYSYIPEYIGTHTIEYLFEDNIYSEKFSYTVNSLDLSNVLFVDKIALPSVFIKDAIYDLDDYFAYVATQNGLSKHTAKLLVSVDGEDFIEIQNQHRFKVEGNESLSFKAEYLGKQTEIQTCKITDVNFNHNPNVNNGSKLYQNYFVGFDSVEFTDSYIDYKFNGNKSELFQFATPLVFDSFRFYFEIPTESVDKLSSINIILKEISGKDSGYVISYNKTSSSASFYFTIKGIDGVTYFANSVSGSFGGAHFIIISNSNVTTSENIAISLPGVSSRNVEFSVSMPDTTGEFSFYVKNVGGTIFSKYIYEKSPELIYRRPYGYPQVGVEYVLPTFNVSSVFYPISLDNLKYSYRDNNGNYLLDVNGNEIKDISGNAPAITILPKEVKYYRLEISYDNFGQYLFVQDVGNFIVSVIDMVAPKTTFNDGSNENTVVNLKLGSNHKFKKFKVVDDVTISDNLIVKIVVMDESGAILAWDAKDSYRFSKAGKYKVIVFAQDENGNASKTYYNVLVK
ncbi:MAG: hypothetical protein IJX03_01135, partial [Clostridia bacterium]|nr:hypothetical protein [Clostridia bacterium]